MDTRRRLLTFALPVAIMAVGCVGAYADDFGGDEKLSLEKTLTFGTDVPLPTLGAFDISFVDPKLELYILADRTNASVDLFDSADPHFIANYGSKCPADNPAPYFCFQGVVLNADGTANNALSGPDGDLIVDHKEIWAGDGDSRVKVLDVKTGTFITTISTVRQDEPGHTALTDKRVDEMAYDPRDHRLAAANNAADPPFVTVFDTEKKTIVAQLVFQKGSATADVDATNGIEQPQWSPETGLFYISVPNVGPTTDHIGGVAVIDPKTNTVTGTFLVSNCEPNGLAVGPRHEALLGCGTAINNETNSVIIDITKDFSLDKAVVATVPIGGSDEVWYDRGTAHYFLGADNNLKAGKNLPLLGSIDAKTHKLDPSPVSSRTAHSVAADKNSHYVFLPFGIPTAAQMPDTFNHCQNTGCIQVYKARPESDEDRVAEREDSQQ